MCKRAHVDENSLYVGAFNVLWPKILEYCNDLDELAEKVCSLEKKLEQKKIQIKKLRNKLDMFTASADRDACYIEELEGQIGWLEDDLDESNIKLEEAQYQIEDLEK